jgi:hypothetical protein
MSSAKIRAQLPTLPGSVTPGPDTRNELGVTEAVRQQLTR